MAQANATLYYGEQPQWWDLKTGDFDSVAAELPEHWFDRIMLDMLDPWNRLEQAYRVIAPGGVLVSYVTTTTQMSRLAEALRTAGCWTEPQIQETLERTWKAQGLAVRPDHQMIGHTGFLVVSRAMAPGFEALRKRDRVTKDTSTDIDSLTEDQREARSKSWNCVISLITNYVRCCAISTVRSAGSPTPTNKRRMMGRRPFRRPYTGSDTGPSSGS